MLCPAADSYRVQRQRLCGQALQQVVVRVVGPLRPVGAADPAGEGDGEADEAAGKGEDGLGDIEVASDEPEMLCGVVCSSCGACWSCMWWWLEVAKTPVPVRRGDAAWLKLVAKILDFWCVLSGTDGK